MGAALKPHLTRKRRAWLETLRDGGPQRRPKGRVGFDCMNLGWTEWNHCRAEPPFEPLNLVAAKAEFGGDWFLKTLIVGERITPAGMLVLAEAEEKD